MSKWKLQSEQFRNAIKGSSQPSGGSNDYYGSSASNFNEGRGIGYSPYVDPSYKQCPNCLRNFNQEAADRHIPVCAKKAKENAMKSKNTVSRQSTVRQTTSKDNGFGRSATMTSTRGFKKSNY